MGAKTFTWIVLAVVALAGGVGIGAALLSSGDSPTSTAPVVQENSHSAPGSEDIPADLRSAIRDNPELAARIRGAAENNPALAARVQEALESGELPEAIGARGNRERRSSANRSDRDTVPLRGAIAVLSDGLLQLETPDGLAEIRISGSTPMVLNKNAPDAISHLATGVDVTVITRTNEAGLLSARAIVIGTNDAGGRRLEGNDGGLSSVRGTIDSFDSGTLHVQTADTQVMVAVSSETSIRVTTTVSEATHELSEGQIATAFVERDQDGHLTATRITVGEARGERQMQGEREGGRRRGAREGRQ